MASSRPSDLLRVHRVRIAIQPDEVRGGAEHPRTDTGKQRGKLQSPHAPHDASAAKHGHNDSARTHSRVLTDKLKDTHTDDRIERPNDQAADRCEGDASETTTKTAEREEKTTQKAHQNRERETLCKGPLKIKCRAGGAHLLPITGVGVYNPPIRCIARQKNARRF